MRKLTTISFTLAMFTTAAFAGDAPKPAAGAPVAPPAMEAPKPPQEVADMAKAMAGSWNCTGTVTTPGGAMPVTATITMKLDLDKWWIQGALTGKVGKTVFKFTEYSTYDAGAKKWHRVGADNMGGSRTMEAAASTDGTMAWEGPAFAMGQAVRLKDTETFDAKAKSMHTVGQISMDGGKTWNPEHDATCKK